MSTDAKLLNRGYVSLFFINLIVAISFSMVTATMSLYVTENGSTAAMAGTVIGSLSIASLFMRPFSGVICDRMRRRRLLQISLLVIGVSMIGYSCTDDVYTLMGFRVLHGLGFSLATTVTMALIAGTIPAGMMTQGLGYFAIGQTISNAISPSIGLWIGEHYGYPACFRLAALLLMVAATLSAFCVAASPKSASTNRKGIQLSDFFAKEALPFCILSIVVAGSTGIENSFIILMGQDLQLGKVGWYFTISATALFLSRIFIGRIADRNSRLVICFGVAAIAVAFLSLGTFQAILGTSAAVAVFSVAAVLKALGLGAAQPALQSASLRSVPEERRGAASCTYYLGADVGQALGPILGGTAVSACGYSGMFALAAIPLLLGIMFYYLFTKHIQKRRDTDVISAHTQGNA